MSLARGGMNLIASKPGKSSSHVYGEVTLTSDSHCIRYAWSRSKGATIVQGA